MVESDVEIILEPAQFRKPGFYILGAELRLGQVLVNVITNAQTFSPPKGKIWVRLVRDRGDILLSVEDQGIGFPADKLNKVFDRFYTDRPEQDGFGKHSGLGLSISKQIITAHGGKIWAENADRNGEISGGRVVIRLPEMPEDFQI
jgi:two-component system sensor histidine kinase ChvG